MRELDETVADTSGVIIVEDETTSIGCPGTEIHAMPGIHYIILPLHYIAAIIQIENSSVILNEVKNLTINFEMLVLIFACASVGMKIIRLKERI
jgi:hypothetical protein